MIIDIDEYIEIYKANKKSIDHKLHIGGCRYIHIWGAIDALMLYFMSDSSHTSFSIGYHEKYDGKISKKYYNHSYSLAKLGEISREIFVDVVFRECDEFKDFIIWNQL